MLIVCPTCATAYQVQPAALGAAGRTVRCAQCKNSWFATAESVAAEAMAGPDSLAEPPPERPPADEFAADHGDAPLPGVAEPDEPEETGQSLMVTDAPSIAPDHPFQDPAASVHPFEPSASEDVETIAARRARQTYVERKNRRTVLQRIASLPVLIVAMLVLLGAALQWRTAIVRHVPQSASLYAAIGLPVNLRGLMFENVKSTGEFVDGAMVLVIEGTIVNPTRAKIDVPRLRFALRNDARHEVYAWTAMPSKTSIVAGEELPFRTRLASPPADGRDVIVRFFNRRDVTAGLQ